MKKASKKKSAVKPSSEDLHQICDDLEVVISNHLPQGVDTSDTGINRVIAVLLHAKQARQQLLTLIFGGAR